jgi:hypothetical protein
MVFNDIIFSDKYFSYIVAVSFINGGNTKYNQIFKRGDSVC